MRQLHVMLALFTCTLLSGRWSLLCVERIVLEIQLSCCRESYHAADACDAGTSCLEAVDTAVVLEIQLS